MSTAPEYTKCVQPQDYKDPPGWLGAVGMAAFVAAMSTLINYLLAGAAAMGAMAGGITVFLFLMIFLLAWVRWWLYGRLICLGGERCAIGLVISVEPPERKTGVERFDSDYSFNLLLPPHQIGADQATIVAAGFLGELIEEQQATRSRNLPFDKKKGYESRGRGCDQDPKTTVLHCEIEGAGMQILYNTLRVVVAMLTAASVASWLCYVPIIGWIACLVGLALLGVAILTLVIGFAIAKDDAAKPSDVDPSLTGSLSWGCGGYGGDIVVVWGEWVYDSLHKGWNEIHPVRHLEKIGGPWAGSWPFNERDAVNRWCGAISASRSPLTQSNQKKPENQWNIHPLIDGCQPSDEDNANVSPLVG